MLLDWYYYGLEVSVQIGLSVLGSKPLEDRTVFPLSTSHGFVDWLNDLIARIGRSHNMTPCFHWLFHGCLPQEHKRPEHYSCLCFQNLEPCQHITGAPEIRIERMSECEPEEWSPTSPPSPATPPIPGHPRQLSSL